MIWGTYKLILLWDFDLSEDAALLIRPKMIDGSNRKGIMTLNLDLELSLVYIQSVHFLKRHHIPIFQSMPSFFHHRHQTVRRDGRDHTRNRVLPILIHNHK